MDNLVHNWSVFANLINKWVELGNQNQWVRKAWDPPFNESSFMECKSVQELWEKLDHGNWCLGVAFYFENICLINQVNGGAEWLVIRDNIPFESISFNRERTPLVWWEKFIKNVKNATEDQIRKCEYTPKEI